jgi:hypothetical protein
LGEKNRFYTAWVIRYRAIRPSRRPMSPMPPTADKFGGGRFVR